MSNDLRLRQVCLVAPALEPAVSDLTAVLEIEVCFRDPAVAAYGLENAVLPIGASFLEVVAPIRPDTAAGRFLRRSAGRGGYMAIFDCADPLARLRHSEDLGIRVAHVIRHEDYLGVQLHPRDCRAVMIEFNRTGEGTALEGSYHPAGPHWRSAVRTSQAKRLIEVELESPDPADLAAHWSRILRVPLRHADQDPRVVLSVGALRFVRVPQGRVECLGALSVAVADVRRALTLAARRGRAVAEDAFCLAGVAFRLQPASSAFRREL
jgi:hypothetical protein